MGAAETAGTSRSALEQLRGNHSQGPHHDRIAHGFDEPGLGAHLLVHDVGIAAAGHNWLPVHRHQAPSQWG
jgi:hypothetical protein